MRELEGAVTEIYDFLNQESSASLTYFCFWDYQCFASNDPVNVNWNNSLSESIDFLVGTLIEEIKRPFTEKNGPNYGDESTVLASLGVCEVSRFWCENHAKIICQLQIRS